jgi:hypothetical protein
MFWVAAIGAGAAAPTVPSNGPAGPTVATYPLIANGISKSTSEIPTRTSTGVYVITIAHQLPLVQFATGAVFSAGASPTAVLVADVTIINAASRTITVKVSTPAGTLTDLGTSDMLVLQCNYHNSSV